MKLTRITLPVRDPIVVGTFYRDVLDLPVDVDPEAASVTVGSTELRFVRDDGPGTDHHLAFTIDVGAVAAARSWLGERTTTITTADGTVTVDWGPPLNAYSLYFEGPEDSVLELIAHRAASSGDDRDAGDDGNGEVSAFDAGMIRSVGEVGIAVDGRVDQVAAELARAGGPVPLDDDLDETFGFVGALDGLLVLVAAGRTWFPTKDRTANVVRTVIEANDDHVRPGTYAPTPSTTLIVS